MNIRSLGHRLSFVCLTVLISAGSACGAGGGETTACSTPKLKEISEVLRSGSTEEQKKLLEPYQEIDPGDVPDSEQRCLIESFLATPALATGRPLDLDTLEVQFGSVYFHRYRQPDYLQALVARRPSGQLVDVHEEVIVPHLLANVGKDDNVYYSTAWFGAVETVLAKAEDGQISLGEEEKARLTEALQKRASLHDPKKAAPLSAYSRLRFAERFQHQEPSESVGMRGLRLAEKAHERGIQINLVEDLLAMGEPSGQVLAAAILEQAKDPDIRTYLQALQTWKPKQQPRPRLSPFVSERLGRERAWVLGPFEGAV